MTKEEVLADLKEVLASSRFRPWSEPKVHAAYVSGEADRLLKSIEDVEEHALAQVACSNLLKEEFSRYDNAKG